MKFTRLDVAGAAGFLVYAASVVVTPIVLLVLAKDLSFGLAEGGGIEAIRAMFLLLILVASGAAAVRWGKVILLAGGAAVLSVGLLTYAFAPVYGVVLAAMVLVGVGSGVLEALVNPLVQDLHPEESGRYLNVVNAFFSIGVMGTVLVAGQLLTVGVHWRYLVGGLGVASASVAVFFLVAGWREHQRFRRRQQGARDRKGTSPWQLSKQILRERGFWFLALAMFTGGGAEGAFTFWTASYVQIHFGALARGGAFGTAAFAGGMVVGRLAFGHYVQQKGLRTLIITSAVAGIAISGAAILANTTWSFFILLFGAGLSVACFWPSIQSFSAEVLPVDSTMLFVLLSCAGIPGFGLTSWFMGLIAEQWGLRASLVIIPAYLLILAVTMLSRHTPTDAVNSAG